MPVFNLHGQVTDFAAEPDHLVFPGFVNAHSHAFQRALRGRVEVRGTGENASDDFWSWRNAMYADAARISPDDVEALATWCYADMLRAGYTTVGEFHYVHHGADGRPYAQPEMSLALVRAARNVGIRLVLLETAYARGGVDKALSETQRRFAFASSDAFLAHVDKVRELTKDTSGVSIGVAVHSVRACPRDWIEAVAAYAAKHDMPLHAHACEQRKELDECRFEHGLSPIALLQECGALSWQSTIVHGTHIEPRDVDSMKDAAALVCVTPSTERNLGDGMCPIADMWRASIDVCIGSDSHARIDVVDELRSLEDHERLRTERRNVLVRAGGRLHHELIAAGARNGLRSLLLLEDEGALKDQVHVAMPIEGRAGNLAIAALTAADAWLVGGSGRDVVRVRVGERVVVDDGRLVSLEMRDVETKAIAVLKRLAS